MKFNFITIHVSDLERSIAFYRDVTGMKLAADFRQVRVWKLRLWQTDRQKSN